MAGRDAVTTPTGKPQGPRELSSSYRALADVTRLRILHALWNTRSRDGITVTDLCEDLRVSQPLMSWHLRILRRAGLVMTRRAGRQVLCFVDQRVTEDYGALLQQYLGGDSGDEVIAASEPAVVATRARVAGAQT